MSSTGCSNVEEEVEEENSEQINSEHTPDILLTERQLTGLKRHNSLDIESAKICGHHGHHDTKICKVGLIPSEQPEDQEVSIFQLELPSKRNTIASMVKRNIERTNFAKFALLFAAMLGTSMFKIQLRTFRHFFERSYTSAQFATPARPEENLCKFLRFFWFSLCVLSAVSGLKEATDAMTEGRIVIISVLILITLFMVQRFGTDKVGYSFAPIICVWFALIAGIGVYNFIKFDPSVAKAINPKYIIDYFKRNEKDGWISLGGIVLAITGTEAMFADLGHFTVKSIQISMGCVVYPALITAYSGQASWLRNHRNEVADTFYKSAPDALYWPVFVVAVMAAIIASQAMISGTFSIIKQSLSLGCFPCVQVLHTSAKYEGQVFIPEVNYLLMIGCVLVTVSFKTTEKIGHAYGIAVIFAETLTSGFMVMIMLVVWKTNILLVILYVLVISSTEYIYLSAVLYKFGEGGYLPFSFAVVLVFIMCTWNYVYRGKYNYELSHKVSQEAIKDIVMGTNMSRMGGLAIFYSELAHGIPPIFKHYIDNVPALHSVVVFVSVKSLPISRVATEERFLFRRVKPNGLYVFRCVVRYGYKDARNEKESFENILFERLKEFIEYDYGVEPQPGGLADEEDMVKLDKAWQAGVVHLVGEHEIVSRTGSSIGKKFIIDYAYNFMNKILRQSYNVFEIPHKRMLKVGMTYEL
ncbi:potassium transporter 5-like [Bidens hawaiensis]|uniref:potassium transporter 5-like n=1 Tax=Bidens hawaiensis TaxID=980011 RepID=UPI00404A5CDF